MELPSPGVFFSAVAVWAVLSALVFRHAERNGSKRATAWGVATFLGGLLVVPVYVLHHRRRRRRG